MQTERALRILSKCSLAQGHVQHRASVILLAAEGLRNKDAATEVRLDRRQMALWRPRFIDGIEGLLQGASRSGRTRSETPEIEWHIPDTTAHAKPGATTHRSHCRLASHLDLSATTIRRVRRRNRIKPDLQDIVKISGDSRFEIQRADVVAPYMTPPERPLVLSCDETSQIQALDRTQPGLLMQPGRTSTMIYD